MILHLSGIPDGEGQVFVNVVFDIKTCQEVAKFNYRNMHSPTIRTPYQE